MEISPFSVGGRWLLGGMLAAVLSSAGCRSHPTLFRMIGSDHSHIHFSNRVVENDSVNPIDLEFLYNGGGVAVGDFNRDGLMDLYFTGSEVSNKILPLMRADFPSGISPAKQGWVVSAGGATGPPLSISTMTAGRISMFRAASKNKFRAADQSALCEPGPGQERRSGVQGNGGRIWPGRHELFGAGCLFRL